MFSMKLTRGEMGLPQASNTVFNRILLAPPETIGYFLTGDIEGTAVEEGKVVDTAS